MSLTPAMAVHLTAALGALALGPFIFWGRRRFPPSANPNTTAERWHRAAGHAWVTLMLVTAFSALFLRHGNLPGWQGFSVIHVLVPITLVSLTIAMAAIYRGNVGVHRRTMLGLYLGTCVGAGAFTLLPGRYLGNLLWHEWLGWL